MRFRQNGRHFGLLHLCSLKLSFRVYLLSVLKKYYNIVTIIIKFIVIAILHYILDLSIQVMGSNPSYLLLYIFFMLVYISIIREKIYIHTYALYILLYN